MFPCRGQIEHEGSDRRDDARCETACGGVVETAREKLGAFIMDEAHEQTPEKVLIEEPGASTSAPATYQTGAAASLFRKRSSARSSAWAASATASASSATVFSLSGSTPAGRFASKAWQALS
jgi:hypothetical protein